MEFLGVRNLAVSAKGVRGLAHNAEFAGSIVATLNPVLAQISVLIMGSEVKAGVPNSFPVSLGAPANATVKTIAAKLTVTSGPSDKTDMAADIKVTDADGNTASYGVGVAVAPPAGLQNVEVRLEDGEVLWSHPGTLAVGTYDIPDFAEQANAYLDKLPPDAGNATLNFILKSDAAGRAAIKLDNLDWSLIQTQAWKNELDATLRLDRTIVLGFGDKRLLDLDPLAVPTGKAPKRLSLRLDAGGQFGPDRAIGPADAETANDFVRVDAGIAFGQRLRLDAAQVKAPLQCSGVAIRIAPPVPNDPPAEFYAELQPDQGGFPAAAAALAKANIRIEPPAEGVEPKAWLRVPFDTPVELTPDTLYWLVLKAVTGTAKVGLRPAGSIGQTAIASDRAAVNRGGKIWRALPPRKSADSGPQSLVILIYTPGPDTQASAVAVTVVGAGSAARFDPAATARTVDIPLPAQGPAALRLAVTAYAEGSLTVANIIQEYGLS